MFDMSEKPPAFLYGADHLTAGKALALARHELRGILPETVRKKVRSSQEIVQKIVDNGGPVYGVNTGFGPLCTTRISPEDTRELQFNILKSHSVGVGPPVEEEIARLMLILKLHAELAQRELHAARLRDEVAARRKRSVASTGVSGADRTDRSLSFHAVFPNESDRHNVS